MDTEQIEVTGPNPKPVDDIPELKRGQTFIVGDLPTGKVTHSGFSRRLYVRQMVRGVTQMVRDVTPTVRRPARSRGAGRPAGTRRASSNASSSDDSSDSSGGDPPPKPSAALAANKLPLSLRPADHLPAIRLAGADNRAPGGFLPAGGAASGWIIHLDNGNSYHADNYEQRGGTISASARYRSVTGAEGNKIVRYSEPKTYVWPVSTVKIRGVNR